MVGVALDLPRDLKLLGALRERLAEQGVRAEVREYLLSLLVFRDSRLPVCVFVGGNGRFYSWESGREHVGDVERAAAQLTDLASSPAGTAKQRPRALPVTFQRSYAGAVNQVSEVRADLAQVVEDFPAADDLVLLASELSTNSILHSRSGQLGRAFTVRVEVHPGRYAWLEVEDEGGEWIKRDPDDEHGRGLDILAVLAGDGNWGIESGETPGTRVVWACLDWPE